MRGGGFGCAVNFDEHETRRVVLLLANIETRDAGFLGAVPGIVESGLPEGVDRIGLHANMNVDDEHGGSVAG